MGTGSLSQRAPAFGPGGGFWLCLALALALSAPGAAAPAEAQSGGYVADVADLPLMPGLTELKGAGVAFDKPSGRIVEAYARGDVTRAAVLAFYRDTLPQLGWTLAGSDGFRREGEVLALEFLDETSGASGKAEGPLTLRFILRPE